MLFRLAAVKTLDMLSFMLDLPFSTILKILLTVLFVVCLNVLAPLLMTLFLATLLAVSLAPVVNWMQKKGINRSISIGLITLILAGSMVTVVAIIAPKLGEEISNFVSNLPKLKEHLMGAIPESNPFHAIMDKIFSNPTSAPKTEDIKPVLNVGNYLFGGFTEIILIFVFSIYLLIDGKGVVTWISAFFNPITQGKIKETTNGVSPIIFSYVVGQLITSLLSFFYVFAALSLLHVPSALLLAMIAGLLDILPVLGFFLAVIPAMLFASSVSGPTVVYVILLYLLYHALENYLITPAVYGKRLRVSTFVVLLTLICAGLLAGIEGAIAALPIVASYPIIERIWLKKYVGRDTVAEHFAQSENQK